MYFIYSLFILSFLFPCNIGVAYDSNNIPVIWKNRDRPISHNQESIDEYIEEYGYNVNLPENRANWLFVKPYNNYHDVLSISSADSDYSRFIGMNEKGFAIVNSVIDNDVNENDGLGSRNICNSGQLITEALKECETIDDFRIFLDTLYCTDSNKIIASNFAVLDANGQGGVFEFYIDFANGNKEIDETLLSELNPYIIRTNHFINLNHNNPSDIISSEVRYNKSVDIISSIIDTFEFDQLFNLKTFIETDLELPLLRHFSDADGDSHPIPYSGEPGYNIPIGYFNTKWSINRSKTVSSVIIIGQDPAQDESETIIWANLGNPITSPYLPFKITDFIDGNGDWIENPLVSEDYNEEDLTSEFSIHSHEIREKIINYNQNSLFDRYINSYLIKSISEEIYELESNLIDDYLNPDFDIHDVAIDVIENMELFYNTFEQYDISNSQGTGDINCDGQLDISDLIIIVGYINSYFDLSTEQVTIADYSGDGIVDILDIVSFLQIIHASE